MSRFSRRALQLVPAAAVLGCCVMVACGIYVARTSSHNSVRESFLAGIGKHRRAVTTSSPLAQRYFDQGLACLYAFDANAAYWSFRSAVECDPDCPMAYWGMAMANGPRVNAEFPAATREIQACRAVSNAQMRRDRASPVERALIDALGTRHTDPPPTDRRPLDHDYADAMRRVWKMFPTDADVGALTAEAIMLLHSRNLWKPDGKPQAETNELRKVLDDVLALDPDHPFAVHLLVHTFEASPTPERADSAADKLRTLAPGLHHLLHMPSHVDIQRGRWREAVLTSTRAVTAGRIELQHTRGVSPTALDMVHDYHMLTYAAMMRGDSRIAFDAVGEMLKSARKGSVDPRYTSDGYCAMRYECWLRFGRWRDMLVEPQPSGSLPLDTALWHYARGVAFAAQKQIGESLSEHAALALALQSVPRSATFRDVPASRIITLAEKMLAGEVLYRQGQVDAGVAVLREAVKQEDGLPSALPPIWLLHTRHALGATLMDAKRCRDAEIVYREDLRRHPENGWSLYGLAESLKMQRRTLEAAMFRRRFEIAWKDADFALSSSCCCLPGSLVHSNATGDCKRPTTPSIATLVVH
jgi:hypothetical protein